MTDAVGSVIDEAAFEGLLEAVGGDRAFLAELVGAFVSDAPVQVAAMRAAVESGDGASLVRPAHTLKSSAASLGALTLSELCGVAEAQARSGDLSAAPDVVESVALATDAAISQLLDLAPAT